MSSMDFFLESWEVGIRRPALSGISLESVGRAGNPSCISPDLVTILIHDLPLENIGKAGKLRCDP